MNYTISPKGFFVVCTSSLIIYTTFLLQPLAKIPNEVWIMSEPSSFRRDQQINLNLSNTHHSTQVLVQGPRIILLWTSYFGQESRHMMGDADKSCINLNKCLITSDREYLSNATAVVFHSRSMSINDLPKIRHDHQIWIYLNRESPSNTPEDLTLFANLFNWTMTYRSDSTVHHPYGVIQNVHLLPENKPPLATGIEAKIANKTKLVAWVVSNCVTGSRREGLASELQKYVQVDIFGQCGNNSCPKPDVDCFTSIEKHYKFYLSFENSLCKDYVTEKYYNALNHSIVPVVFGAANYTKISPHKSFLDVRDFKGMKELAEYLNFLDKNPKEYLKYFWWKDHYTIKRTDGWCSLCEKLIHWNASERTVINDLSRWYKADHFGDSLCHVAYI